jgi:hypothetical protein
MHSVSVVIADRANHEFMIYHELFRGLAITDKGCHRSWNLGTTVLCGNSRKRGNSRNSCGNSRNSCGNFAARVEETVPVCVLFITMYFFKIGYANATLKALWYDIRKN